MAFTSFLHRRRRKLIAQRFAAGCGTFFEGANFKAGDQVFLTGVSELELNGLADFWRPTMKQPKPNGIFSFISIYSMGGPTSIPLKKTSPTRFQQACCPR